MRTIFLLLSTVLIANAGGLDWKIMSEPNQDIGLWYGYDPQYGRILFKMDTVEDADGYTVLHSATGTYLGTFKNVEGAKKYAESL